MKGSTILLHAKQYLLSKKLNNDSLDAYDLLCSLNDYSKAEELLQAVLMKMGIIWQPDKH